MLIIISFTLYIEIAYPQIETISSCLPKESNIRLASLKEKDRSFDYITKQDNIGDFDGFIIAGVLQHSVINIPRDANLSTSGDVVYIERVSLNAIFNSMRHNYYIVVHYGELNLLMSEHFLSSDIQQNIRDCYN